MKRLFSLLFFAVLSPLSVSAEWTVMKLTGQQAPLGLESFMVLEKMIRMPGGDFSTGIITNSVLKVSEMQKLKIPNQTPNQMAEEIRVALKAPAWTHSQVEGLDIYTMKWPEKMAYFRLIIQKDNKYVRTSFANLRPPYALMESLEADLLQRAFFQLEKRKTKKTAHYFQKLFEAAFLNEVQAVEVNTDTAFRAYEGFMSRVDQISQHVARDGLMDVSSAIRDVGGQGIGAIDRATAAAQGVGSNVAGSIRDAGGSVEKAANTARDALRETMKFTNAAKFGLGLGLGFGVGSAVSTAATNLIMSGSGKLVREVYYYALGKMKPEDRAALQSRANDAFARWEEHSQKIEDIQKELMKYEMAYASATKMPVEFALKDARAAQDLILDLQLKIEDLKKNIPKADGTDRSKCLREINNLQNQLAYTETMYSILREAGQTPSKDLICNRMRDLLGSWVRSEAALHNAKMVISMEMGTILNAIRSDSINSFTDPVRQRPQVNECLRLQNERIERFNSATGKKCSSEDRSPACQQVSEQSQRMSQSRDECAEIYQFGRDANTVDAMVKASKMTDAEIAEATRQLKLVATSHCDPGQKDAVCDGKAGGLSVIRESYLAKTKLLENECPGVKPPSVDLGFSQESLQTGMPPNSNEVQAMARAPRPAPSQPSFWSRMWSSLKSFFSFH